MANYEYKRKFQYVYNEEKHFDLFDSLLKSERKHFGLFH